MNVRTTIPMLLAIPLTLAACQPACETFESCDACARSGCVWVQFEDGATECGADPDDYPPADAAITTDAGECAEE